MASSGSLRSAQSQISICVRLSAGRAMAHWMVSVSISVAIGQLEIKTDLLNTVVAIVLISVGVAVALALGLGSREIAGQIIAGIYVRELYRVGQAVRIGDLEGQIEEIGTVKTILLTTHGELVSLANRSLLDERVSSR